jgi:L-ascorbate metabolism protein UlaG (beta-lactamase superfamily)
MTVTKFGHCCLLLEVNEKRILTDPGRFSEKQNTLTNIDLVLITHEHADHYHAESVQIILKQNPSATIVTNSSVAKLLKELDVDAEILEGESEVVIKNILLNAYDGKHIEIVGEFGIVQNTGYLVDNYFFLPGDAYTVPKQSVDILALPVAGPWCKISEAIAYAKKVEPKIAVPVHDATLNETGKSVTYPHFSRELEKIGSRFQILEEGVAVEL